MDFTRPRRRHKGIELTPLIDVVFLLLVFLILTTNFQRPSLALELPRGTSQDEAQEQAVLVELRADGTLALEGDSISTDAFDSALKAALEPLELRAVRLLADEQVNYGQLLPIIERVRTAGAAAVDLVHEVNR